MKTLFLEISATVVPKNKKTKVNYMFVDLYSWNNNKNRLWLLLKKS